MIEHDRYKFGFKIKEIWFAGAPYDVKGYDAVYFNACKEKRDLEGFARIDNTTLTIDLTQDINTIWQNMSKSSCRYAINRAKNRGIKTFDFGGYSPETHPTIASFKKSFGGVVTSYYNYVKIYSKMLKSLKMVL